ncbi:MAG TPA: hypothetical protein VFX70_16435 [Mycobacteriales bacterium]|nr:hypothetical protein [Mycobacteriales bacterium]
MFSYPGSAEVFAELGDKVLEAFSQTVRGATEDLRDYRAAFPTWVADHSERGLSNWIHDRLWARVEKSLDAIPGVTVSSGEPTREVTVGLRYRLRMKRHSEDGAISTYHTQTALEFNMQGLQEAFPNMEEIRLTVGYVWNPRSRTMGDPVLSLRDGMDNVVWVEVLPDFGQAAGNAERPIQPTPVPPVSGPPTPTVEVHTAEESAEDSEGKPT